MENTIERQHADMRTSLEQLRSLQDLTFRSEEVPSLLVQFLGQVYQHFKSEKQALASAAVSAADKAAYDAHYLAVLEEISEIQFKLIEFQDMPVALVLPRMEAWVADHEGLHSHLQLPLA